MPSLITHEAIRAALTEEHEAAIGEEASACKWPTILVLCVPLSSRGLYTTTLTTAHRQITGPAVQRIFVARIRGPELAGLQC